VQRTRRGLSTRHCVRCLLARTLSWRECLLLAAWTSQRRRRRALPAARSRCASASVRRRLRHRPRRRRQRRRRRRRRSGVAPCRQLLRARRRSSARCGRARHGSWRHGRSRRRSRRRRGAAAESLWRHIQRRFFRVARALLQTHTTFPYVRAPSSHGLPRVPRAALRCAHPGLSASNAHPATSRQRAPWSRVILLAVLSIMALNVAVPVTVVSLIS
jgi:hypothetical protein